MRWSTRRFRLVPGAVALPAAVALLSGCGGAGRSTAAANRAPAPQPAAAARVPAPSPRIEILTPRAGARTGSTLTVRVRLTGAPPGRPLLRYVLDGRSARAGETRLTLHEVLPGRHRLEVILAGDARIRASSTFVVHAPAALAAAPAAPAAPVPAAPAQSSTGAAPPSPAPARTHSEPAPAPPPPRTTPSTPAVSTPSPAPAGGIPQGGGGDGDADNSGGPTDGDGNV